MQTTFIVTTYKIKINIFHLKTKFHNNNNNNNKEKAKKTDKNNQ